MVPKENGRRPAVARAHCDVFQAGLPRQGIAKLYKCRIFVITRHNLPSKVRLHNDQTPRNVYVWMQQ